MGQCVICSKECDKVVEFYSAELADDSNSYYNNDKDSNFNTPRNNKYSKQNYTNIEKKYGYYCFRHNIPFSTIIVGVLNIAFTVSAIQSFLDAIRDTEWLKTHLLPLLFLLAVLLFVWVVVIYFLQTMITGKYYFKFIESRYWNRDSEYELKVTRYLNKQEKKNNTNKRYLTRREFNQLK